MGNPVVRDPVPQPEPRVDKVESVHNFLKELRLTVSEQTRLGWWLGVMYPTISNAMVSPTNQLLIRAVNLPRPAQHQAELPQRSVSSPDFSSDSVSSAPATNRSTSSASTVRAKSLDDSVVSVPRLVIPTSIPVQATPDSPSVFSRSDKIRRVLRLLVELQLPVEDQTRLGWWLAVKHTNVACALVTPDEPIFALLQQALRLQKANSAPAVPFRSQQSTPASSSAVASSDIALAVDCDDAGSPEVGDQTESTVISTPAGTTDDSKVPSWPRALGTNFSPLLKAMPSPAMHSVESSEPRNLPDLSLQQL